MKKIEMNQIDIEERKHSFEPFLLGYSFTQAKQEASRCLNCKDPRCVKACPINNHIPNFIKEIVNDNIENAYRILMKNTVLPEICGIVCCHDKQCQGSCVKGIKGDPLSIGALERYVGEYARLNNLDSFKNTNNKKNVAIVGSGPAGIASAYYLSKIGYNVTIYEKENYLGGVLSWGIPSFRLNKEIVSNYFERLKKLDVNFVLNCEIDKDITIDELLKNNDHVILAIGALIPNSMNINEEKCSYVIQAKQFLSELSKMNKDELSKYDKYGEKILVIGGGNVAFDTARSAVRLPGVKDVTIVYRRTEEEMPVSLEELIQAKQEGVNIMCLTNPVKFHENNKVECALMMLGEKDETNRRKPIDSNKEHIYLDADTAILAIGFKNDSEFYKDSIKKDDKSRLSVDENYETNIENVYAVGDAVSGPHTVVKAMKQALDACRYIAKKDGFDY